MSKLLLDQLITDVPAHPHVEARVKGLLDAIADRVDETAGDPVRVSDLSSILRQDPDAIAAAVLKNPPEPAPVVQPPVAEHAPFEQPPHVES